MTKPLTVLLDVIFVQRVTPRGIIVDLAGEDHVCIPSSAIACMEAFDTGDAHCTITVDAEWAKKKGLL